jgi:HSP20 family protein
MATMLVEPFAPWLRELNQALQGQGATATPFVPPADLLVTQDGVTVYMDVPGLRSEDLEIELENDVLTVRGERPFPYSRENGSEPAWRIERSFGRVERSLRVPGGLDPDSIQASLSNGVLTLQIPRPASPRAKRIEIKAEQANGSRSEQHSQAAGGDSGAGGSRAEDSRAESAAA